jgi:hypothetical protein
MEWEVKEFYQGTPLISERRAKIAASPVSSNQMDLDSCLAFYLETVCQYESNSLLNF